jgi:hypothetical protein
VLPLPDCSPAADAPVTPEGKEFEKLLASLKAKPAQLPAYHPSKKRPTPPPDPELIDIYEKIPPHKAISLVTAFNKDSAFTRFTKLRLNTFKLGESLHVITKILQCNTRIADLRLKMGKVVDAAGTPDEILRAEAPLPMTLQGAYGVADLIRGCVSC